MRRLPLLVALLLVTACEKTVYITAPVAAVEEKMAVRSVAVGEAMISSIVLPVTDPDEEMPRVEVDLERGLLETRGIFVIKETEYYGGPTIWIIQVNFLAKSAGTETVTLKLTNRPAKYWTQKVVIAGSFGKG